jgi:uncharacterized membrane protein YbhN (UPF0104 family)
MSAPAERRRTLRAEPLAPPGADSLPEELAPRRLLRRLLEAGALLVIVLLVALLAPGLGEVRQRLADASPGWIVLAVVLELLSCLSYVLLFRAVFCRLMSWRTSM